VDLVATDPAATSASATRWLVIEDDPADQARIAGALASSGFDVDVASNVEQALNCASQKGYDALSLDLMSGSPGGLDVLARIRDEDRGGDSSVAALTINGRSGGNAAFEVADVFTKPLRAEEIVGALRRFGLDHRPEVTVMIIDDDPVALELMRVTLQDHGVASVSHLDGRAALDALDRTAPAAIILDLLMPGIDGFAVLDELRGRPRWCDIPVFVWTNMALTDSEYDLLAISASTILRKGGGDVEGLLERLRRWRPTANILEGSVR
jgi:CheY-like chemotaxis protein